MLKTRWKWKRNRSRKYKLKIIWENSKLMSYHHMGFILSSRWSPWELRIHGHLPLNLISMIQIKAQKHMHSFFTSNIKFRSDRASHSIFMDLVQIFTWVNGISKINPQVKGPGKIMIHYKPASTLIFNRMENIPLTTAFKEFMISISKY